MTIPNIFNVFLSNFLKTFYTKTHTHPSAGHRQKFHSNTSNIYAKLQAFQQKFCIQSARTETHEHNQTRLKTRLVNGLNASGYRVTHKYTKVAEIAPK